MDVTPTFTQTFKDTAYVAVGLSVLGFQRAQVARRDLGSTVAADRHRLEASVKAQVEDLSGVLGIQLSEFRIQAAKAVSNLEDVLEPMTKELEGRLDEVEQRLPDHLQAVVASARQAAEAAASQVRSLLAA